MTEAEWLAATDPRPMLEFLRGRVSDRELRLFACGCCRQFWQLNPGEHRTREAVFVSERFADGEADRKALKSARKRARHCEVATCRSNAYEAACETAAAAAHEVRYRAIDYEGGDAIAAGYTLHTPAADRLAGDQCKHQCSLLREIVRNPFSQARIALERLRWNDQVVSKVAFSIYNEVAFHRVPLLADALEDAGCSDAELLGHLRGPGPHVRGCWAVDLLLEKS
jgi:hypothetical protein